MCGILGLFDAHDCATPDECRKLAIKQAKLLRHRGPDWSGVHVYFDGKKSAAVAHERLAIVDPESGAQPLKNKEGTLILAANGEIYSELAYPFLRENGED